MSESLSKETLQLFIDVKRAEDAVNEKGNKIIKMISVEIREIFENCTNKNTFKIALKFSDDFENIIITMSLDDFKIEPYVCKNEILYDDTALLIEIRNIKDVLCEARRTIKNTPKPKNFWERFYS